MYTMENFGVQTVLTTTRKTMKKRNAKQSVQHTYKQYAFWLKYATFYRFFSCFTFFFHVYMWVFHHFFETTRTQENTKCAIPSKHIQSNLIEYSKMQLPALSAIFLYMFYSYFLSVSLFWSFVFCTLTIVDVCVCVFLRFHALGMVLVKRKQYRIVIEEDWFPSFFSLHLFLLKYSVSSFISFLYHSINSTGFAHR